MKITYPVNLSNMDVSDPGFVSNLSKFITDAIQVINGGIDIYGNCNIAILNPTFTVANTELAITHNLQRIPNGYILIGAQAATQLYDGVTANTPSSIYVRSTVATTVKILVF